MLTKGFFDFAMQNTHQQALKSILEWQLDHGVDEAVGPAPHDFRSSLHEMKVQPAEKEKQRTSRIEPAASASEGDVPSFTEQVAQAKELAEAAQSLEELKDAIAAFDGLDVKKTATNLVFSDGNPKAKIMIIGEAPGADEDREGKPFVGVSGKLLDKILSCIDLARDAEDPDQSVYISNVLNWRPPGNRTPTDEEMKMAKPFIERHIQLVEPDILLFCGGVAAQTLLHTRDSISKLRGKLHDFVPQILEGEKSVPAIATYHPAYLLRTPSQKGKVWEDMLLLQSHRFNYHN